jgi:Ca2+-binding RTX toxin-like protein
VEGRNGADVLQGGPGRDAASYAHALGPVTASLAAPAGNTGDAAGDSYVAIENLTGSPFNDTLTGDGLANRLKGNKGADVETGGAGNDAFVYLRLDDSPPGATSRDRIADFDAGTATSTVDRIDVSAIDAQTGPGNQAFTFIGSAPFTLGVKGQLRAFQSGASAIVAGDTNGDQAADIEIQLLNFSNLAGLTAEDFIR